MRFLSCFVFFAAVIHTLLLWCMVALWYVTARVLSSVVAHHKPWVVPVLDLFEIVFGRAPYSRDVYVICWLLMILICEAACCLTRYKHLLQNGGYDAIS